MKENDVTTSVGNGGYNEHAQDPLPPSFHAWMGTWNAQNGLPIHTAKPMLIPRMVPSMKRSVCLQQVVLHEALRVKADTRASHHGGLTQ